MKHIKDLVYKDSKRKSTKDAAPLTRDTKIRIKK